MRSWPGPELLTLCALGSGHLLLRNVIDEAVPEVLDMSLVIDNYSTHKAHMVKQ